MMLNIGDKVPTQALKRLPSVGAEAPFKKDEWTVLYFYPKDDTPGCTREAQGFSLLAKEFRRAGAAIYGISKDTVAKHRSFVEKYALTIPLLSDESLDVHKAFGTFGEKVMYGKKIMGTIRSTFVVAPNGKIAAVYPKVKVDGHPEAVLRDLRALQTGQSLGGSAPKKTSTKPKPATKTATKKPAMAPRAKSGSKKSR